MKTNPIYLEVRNYSCNYNYMVKMLETCPDSPTLLRDLARHEQLIPEIVKEAQKINRCIYVCDADLKARLDEGSKVA